MSMEARMMEGITKAESGQRIGISGNHVMAMQVVEDSCGTNGGHWFCGVHDEHFANNMQWWNHCDEGTEHLAVWMCHEHGPEVP